MTIDLDALVWIKRPGFAPHARYHHFDETDRPSRYHRSRCGLVRRADCVAWTERFAFSGLNARPCGRCWFRTWRIRIVEIEAQIAGEEAA